MTYEQFTELKKGDKITLSAFSEIFKNGETATIKDNSVRGVKTEYIGNIKVGDWVNNGTRFIEIV